MANQVSFKLVLPSAGVAYQTSEYFSIAGYSRYSIAYLAEGEADVDWSLETTSIPRLGTTSVPSEEDAEWFNDNSDTAYVDSWSNNVANEILDKWARIRYISTDTATLTVVITLQE